ncbi:MAG: hypothetical protein NVS9B15_13160 [Acidobacteriaceae bacterium]
MTISHSLNSIAGRVTSTSPSCIFFEAAQESTLLAAVGPVLFCLAPNPQPQESAILFLILKRLNKTVSNRQPL